MKKEMKLIVEASPEKTLLVVEDNLGQELFRREFVFSNEHPYGLATAMISLLFALIDESIFAKKSFVIEAASFCVTGMPKKCRK